MPSVWTIWNASSDCRNGSVETGNRISTDQRHAAAFYPACWSYQLWQTYHALERLKEASCGVYLGPLRLLALEIYEKMKDAGIACTMLTGEECIPEENSRITSSTIEC